MVIPEDSTSFSGKTLHHEISIMKKPPVMIDKRFWLEPLQGLESNCAMYWLIRGPTPRLSRRVGLAKSHLEPSKTSTDPL